jgi:predicted PurR-regulated permease PerM
MTSKSPSASDSGQQPSRRRPRASLAVLAGICIAFAALFFQVVRPLALPLFLAAVLAVLAFPLHARLTARFGGRGGLSALLIVTVLVLGLLGPTTAGFVAAYRRSLDAVALFDRAVRTPDGLDDVLRRVARMSRLDPDDLRDRAALAVRDGEQLLFRQAAQAVGGAAWAGLGLVLFAVAGFYFLRDGPSILGAWEDLTPLSLDHDREVRRQFAVVCRAVVLSTILAALAQAVALGLALGLLELIFGLGLARWLVLLFVLSFVLSMVPMVGPSLVWLPLSAWMFYEGHYAAGVALVAIGVVVVSNVDNLVRMEVLRGSAGMHPLLALVSVLGGLHEMGAIGVFVGPVVAGVFLTLLRILKQQLDRDWAAPPRSPAPAREDMPAVTTNNGGPAS